VSRRGTLDNFRKALREDLGTVLNDLPAGVELTEFSFGAGDGRYIHVHPAEWQVIIATDQE
jgi:hypothetical protein